MKKTLIVIIIVAVMFPIYAGRANFESSTPAVTTASVVSGTTISLVSSVASIKFSIKTPKVWLTAYSSTLDQTDSTPFITASGERVRDGIIATNIFSFGTKIKIPSLFGDKIFTVKDRMSARKRNGVDIWMPTRAEALDFGAHRADIVVVYNPNIDSLIALK